MLLSDERLDVINESLSLIQKRNGLTFGTDAYLLYAYLRRAPHAKAADLGAGSGVVSLLALTKGKVGAVTAVEVQDSYAALCRRNAERNALSEKLTVLCRDLRTVTQAEVGVMDVVFSNPPYLVRGAGQENAAPEKTVARREICGGIEDFVACAARLLKNGGRFYLVYRPERLGALFEALAAHGLAPKRLTTVHADLGHAPSLVLLEADKARNAGLYVTPPLFLKHQGKDSEECRYLYENGEFHDCYYRPGRKK